MVQVLCTIIYLFGMYLIISLIGAFIAIIQKSAQSVIVNNRNGWNRFKTFMQMLVIDIILVAGQFGILSYTVNHWPIALAFRGDVIAAPIPNQILILVMFLAIYCYIHIIVPLIYPVVNISSFKDDRKIVMLAMADIISHILLEASFVWWFIFGVFMTTL